MNKWKRIEITPESKLLPLYQKVLKQVTDKREELIVKVLNRERTTLIRKEIYDFYKFEFNWIDNETVAIEFYQRIEIDEPTKEKLPEPSR